MYNNIDTRHAIRVISAWLQDLHSKGKLPDGFPLDAVVSAMTTIMSNNLFEWGDMYFLQLIGTAMGTSAAVMWATLYFAYHKEHTLIPEHGHKMLYFRRFIDDIFAIWIGNLTTDWSSFCKDVNNFGTDEGGILTWDIEDNPPATSVDFLDLTLLLKATASQQKPSRKNESVSIPPSSISTP